MLRKISQILIAPLFYLFLSPGFVFADTPVNPCPQEGTFSKLCSLTAGNFGQTVGRVLTAAFVLAVLIALAFLVYGGVKWITSGGDKTAVEGARNTLVAAVVGLVIVFLAYFIVSIVLGLFGLGSITTLSIPQIIQ